MKVALVGWLVVVVVVVGWWYIILREPKALAVMGDKPRHNLLPSRDDTAVSTRKRDMTTLLTARVAPKRALAVSTRVLWHVCLACEISRVVTRAVGGTLAGPTPGHAGVGRGWGVERVGDLWDGPDGELKRGEAIESSKSNRLLKPR
jgi:hypothetical protein